MRGPPDRAQRRAAQIAGPILAALPLFAGFLTILLDDRRRGVHNMLAGTVVVPAPPEPCG